MPVRRPTAEELERIARLYHFEITPEEAEVYRAAIDATLQSYDRLDQFAEPKLPVAYPRDPGRRPAPEENPTGGWAWRCSIKGREGGPLSGKRIAIKDNVAVAGVPMMNGSALLEGFIPDVDAVIVRRILDAGGEIVGKATCEDLCFSGGSHTSHPWPVRNPRNPEYMAGGSSSGSAALVAAGECDMAIGGDQGGSIRIPSSWCGIFGLKPTYGLVPYTGVFPIELSLDHTGPMAATVRDVALLLEVIAGRDGLDPRQARTPTDLPRYTRALEQGVRGLRIGVVREGFAWPNASEPDVDEAVREAAARFENLGASVEEVSIPLHHEGIHIWNAIAVEGAWSIMVRDEGMGHGWIGYYDTHVMEFYGRSRRVRANDFSHTVKIVTLLGHYMSDRYHGRYYARAQNLRRALTAAYDEALRHVDLLVMPTTPQKAMRLNASPDLAEYLTMALHMIHNTCPFDVSGHPAMNVPCGDSGGLPVGMMLVGRHFEEETILRAAHAFEQSA
ncbi:amidase [Caldinitratiruptor microaerophilus]|uniref:Amidase n=1 Tax=Caldinitratiruptor microaerophilus TaxID=671077 RepID=A0AA35CKX4_9FIRM|nr:amidase [Caldinitratiruptor microaerophilus]BDG59200.1 amidase [Caldinitratiruptor microaerophilus]